MHYTSTRNSNIRISAAEAVINGISPDGGLYLPCEIPQAGLDFIENLVNAGYNERALKILELFLEDFTACDGDTRLDELAGYIEGAYGGGKFDSPDIAPVVNLYGSVHMLELWHGPTSAFKDMALQLLPYLMTGSSRKTGNGSEIVILVATSGDTGKAALEGFADVPDTKIIVFYPNNGVSRMQKLQMTTQEGGNVGVIAINGNFDDAQNGVKAIFTDEKINALLNENKMAFSSANSINWGRLVPQIVYYFSAYCDLVKKEAIKLGDKINFTVPTGNFGNILAAYYAKEMGLPVNRLICASNANNVLTEFFDTGFYNRKRDFYTTVSPSMDILISSNLERLLYELSDRDDGYIRDIFASLAEKGEYTVNEKVLNGMKNMFSGGFCDDRATEAAIRETFEKYNYLCDTHTAVGVRVYEEYRKKTGDAAPCVIASTANPYKFPESVLRAVKRADPESYDEFGMASELEGLTKIKAPEQLTGLKNKNERFNITCEKDSMNKELLKILGL
ncbi:MAG: threonine synthase [Oscillospiraceae bacterium]|nr:threonine synthase [Oscillospiraceae bacterium]